MKKIIIELDNSVNAESLDWEKIKRHGIDGAMIPFGEADYHGRIMVNNFAESCIKAADEIGITTGVIVNIHCKDAFSAHEAAYNTIEILKGYKIKPIIGVAYGFFERKRACLIEQGKDGLTDTALSLLFESERLGYRGMIYSDFDFVDTYMDIKRIGGKRFLGEQNGGWNDKLIMKRMTESDQDYIEELKGFKQYITA